MSLLLQENSLFVQVVEDGPKYRVPPVGIALFSILVWHHFCIEESKPWVKPLC